MWFLPSDHTHEQEEDKSPTCRHSQSSFFGQLQQISILFMRFPLNINRFSSSTCSCFFNFPSCFSSHTPLACAEKLASLAERICIYNQRTLDYLSFCFLISADNWEKQQEGGKCKDTTASLSHTQSSPDPNSEKEKLCFDSDTSVLSQYSLLAKITPLTCCWTPQKEKKSNFYFFSLLHFSESAGKNTAVQISFS